MMKTYEPVKFAYNVFEPASGVDETLSPIIFLHSYGFSKDIWHDIPKIIADRTRRICFVPDARDHGESEWTDHFSFNILVHDLMYFMDNMNIPKAILIGHSMGGWAAGMLAIEQPDRVEFLIIEDMFVEKLSKNLIDTIMSHTCLWQEAVQSIPKELNETEASKFAVDYIFSKLSPLSEKQFTTRECLYKCKLPIKRLQDDTYDVKHNMELFKVATSDSDTFSRDPEGVYTGVTHVLYGSLSNLKIHQHESRLRENFPFVSMILFDGATHNIHIEFPEKFVEVVLKLLDTNNTPILNGY